MASDQPPGIKQIAEALGVSIGTVDRALHGRPGINPETQAKVLAMARSIGYRPNAAARSLKLNRRLRLSIHLPREIAFFFDALRQGIQETAARFPTTVDLTFRTMRRLDEEEVKLFRAALDERADGIIVAPGRPVDLQPWIRKAAREKIPVVCVATDAPKSERLTSVSADPYTSGCMVAEAFLRSSRARGSVLMVTGDLSTVDHAEKLRGLREFLGGTGPLSVGPVIQAHDDADEAYRRVRRAIGSMQDLQAVYVGTANSLPVLRALSEAGRLQKLAVIVTDLFPDLIPYIREGKILCTVYQRPHTQGRMAFQTLYDFLATGKVPPPRLRLAPHLVSRGNLALYLEILSSTVETGEKPTPWELRQEIVDSGG